MHLGWARGSRRGAWTPSGLGPPLREGDRAALPVSPAMSMRRSSGNAHAATRCPVLVRALAGDIATSPRIVQEALRDSRAPRGPSRACRPRPRFVVSDGPRPGARPAAPRASVTTTKPSAPLPRARSDARGSVPDNHSADLHLLPSPHSWPAPARRSDHDPRYRPHIPRPRAKAMARLVRAKAKIHARASVPGAAQHRPPGAAARRARPSSLPDLQQATHR